MQELIDNLINKAGLTQEQASKTIDTVKDYIKEKFPLLEGAVENIFGKVDGAASNIGSSDYVNGAKDKAEDAIDSIKDKLGGFFSGK